jgi:lipopolysaccharide heptosyltransferase I
MRKKLSKPKKILIIKPSSLGDVIHALPFLKAVKNTFPDSQADWVISKNLKGILEGNPLINELIPLDKDSWKSVKKLPHTLAELSSLRKTLKSKHYDIVVDLQGLLRSGLIAFSSPATLKIGFEDAREGSRLFYDRRVTVKDSAHAVDKCLEVAKTIGAKIKKTEFPLHINKVSKKQIKKLLGNTEEYIVIVPSARWITKRWPAEKFSALINDISIPCIITGSKGDKKTAQKIKGNIKNDFSGKIIDLCGKTDLQELTALLAGAKVVVTNDTGPMHIAAALNVPVIALFGPTNPLKTGPYGWQTSKKLKVLKADVPCSPCRRKRCKELVCMNDLTVDTVWKVLKEYV